MDKNIEQLNKLAKLFNADKIITADEVEQILKGVLKIMNTFKKENEDLSAETRSVVEGIINEVSAKYEEIKSTVDEKTLKQGMSLSAEFDSKVQEIKDLMEVVKTLKPENGKDADEEKVIAEVLSKIKLPEYKETVLDDGAKIAEKLNGLNDVLNIEVIKGLQKRLNDIQMNVVSSLPQTTSLINGKRAKNINFSGATVNVQGDTATVVITAGVADNITGLISQGTNVTITGTGTSGDPYVINSTAGGGDALVANPLSQFAATTSAQLAGVISDETGSGKLVFATSPTIESPTFSTVINAPDIKATNSAGILLESANGTDIGLFGAGNTANVAWYGNHNFDTATQDTIAAFTGAGKTLGSLATATYPSLTELAYVKGLTSAIQTQLDARVLDTGDTITGTYNLTGQLNVDNLRLDGNTISSTDTNGDINLTPNGTGMVVVPAGSTTVPAISFTGDLDTGLSRSSTANTGLLMAGAADRFSWNTTTFAGTSSSSALMLRGAGSDSAPSFSQISDTNTGIVLPGSDVLGLTTGGVRALTIDASQVVAIPKLRATPRVTTITSNATPTVNTDDCEFVTITALAAAITSMTTNLSGTPANFQPLTYRIKDNGTARAITWGASFASRGATLPTTTTISKVLNVGFRWNSVASTWDCIATNVEA